MKKRKIKHLIHQKKETHYQKKIDQWLTQKNHFPSQNDIFSKYNYGHDLSSVILNKHYDRYVQPVIDNLKTMPFQYNERDNRLLLTQLNYVESNDGFKLFTGIIVNHKVVLKANQIKIYLLIGNVHAAIKKGVHEYEYRPCTDHIWLDINDFYTALDDSIKEISLSIGDLIHFSGQISTYKGYREGIYQTKYGIQNPVIMDAGYPNIKANYRRNGAMVNLGKSIPYAHHQNYLIKYFNQKYYPGAFPQFGNQIKKIVHHTVYNPKYNYSNQKVLPIRPIIADGLKFNTPHQLIFDPHHKKLTWMNANYKPTQSDQLIGDTQTLQTIGFQKFYNQIIDQYKWRYEKYTYRPSNLQKQQDIRYNKSIKIK